MLLTDKDFLEKYKKKPCMQEIKHTIPQIFKHAPCILSNISWNFHENPSMRFPVMLLADKQTDRLKTNSYENTTFAVRRR